MSQAIAAVIVPRERDLGGFSVRRVLPAAQHPMVGPFVFFDHMGPADFAPGHGIDVRPHPHIGIATVTYLFEGEILHRDSLGFTQPIQPGDVNWMTAGRGIVHSERETPAVRARDHRLNGIQSWIGLPRADEETEPSFVHYPAASLPKIALDGATLRLIAGSAFGETAPVETFSPMFYIDAPLAAGAAVPLPDEHEERAIYVAEGTVTIAGARHSAGTMVIATPGAELSVVAIETSRVMLLGGAPMDGPRHLWWNFVSSSRERIERSKADWRQGHFDPIPGETEFIPLPESS